MKAPWQWISSPLGLNVLLSMLKENVPSVDTYKAINNVLAKKEVCQITSKIFISKSHEAKNNINQLSDNVKDLLKEPDVQETYFNLNGNALTEWVNQYGEFGKDVQKELDETNAQLVLANCCSLESSWGSTQPSGTAMKIYNSFNYTQDVKYEARLLELGLRSGLKLVVIVPNETDMLHGFYTTLARQGLSAALTSIQPLFTVNSELKAPSIEVSSNIQVMKDISSLPGGSAVQYGNISVSEKGTDVKVLTCIYYPSISSTATVGVNSKPPFYFAVVYDDTPIFTGQFTPRG